MVDVVLPKWGLTMEEATITGWLKAVGDGVSAGEPLVEVETDKASGEVESPADGILGEILIEAGTVAEPGQVLGRIYTPVEWDARQ